MRVATWNLKRVCASQKHALREYMFQVNADVWVLTETWADFEPGAGYKLAAHSQAATDLNASNGECWVAIWVREEDRAETVAIEVEQDRQAAAYVAGSGRLPMLVIGTVLPWGNESRLGAAGGAATFCKVLATQAAEWRRLQKLHADSGLCLAGDFNQDLAEKNYYGSTQGKKELLHTFDELRLQCLTGGAHDPLITDPDLASIDHICVGGGLRQIEAVASVAWPKPGTLDKRLTDHYGVYVDIGA